jgi:hypothetical protein
MNEKQSRLWKKMIDLIESYYQGNIKYSRLVGELEGAKDAAEFEQKHLIKKWYDYWTPLEIRRSLEGDDVSNEDCLKELKNMEDFLREFSSDAL